MFNVPSFFGFKGGAENPPLLLDTYSAAAAAYSLRGLSTPYVKGANPYACQVRNSSNVALNIGFVFNSLTGDYELDTTALLAHCGGGNGFVDVWYDQSVSTNNATQTIALNQPQIVSSGSVITESSKPALRFNNAQWLINSVINISQPITRFTIGKSTETTNAGVFLDSNTLADRIVLYKGTVGDNDGNFVALYDELGTNFLSIASNLNRNLFYELGNSGSNEFAINGNTATTGNSGTNGMNQLSIGNIRENVVPSYALTGNIQEIVIYASNQSANRGGIEGNINSFYSIY
jgi:hypothetical protein